MQPIDIQKRLNELGFWQSGISFYNNYGPATKEAVKKYQQSNNLTVDGIAGPKTLRALFPSTPNGCIDFVISQKSLDQIIYFEVGGKSSYKRYPEYPGAQSGITIGIGYDLGYNTTAQITADWQDLVSARTLQYMLSVAGLKGTAAKNKLSAVVNMIEIPYDAALQVMLERTLSRFASQALKAYPGLLQLNYDTKGVMTGLVYNRGVSKEGATRTEMKALETPIQNADYVGIANDIRSMARLWDGDPSNGEIARFKGLVTRRNEEAELVLHSVRDYADYELVHIYI